MSKPKVLILGGVGFVGRNLLQYLLATDCCSKIKIADKCLPVLAFMHPQHEALYENAAVEFVQADLNKPEHMERVFGRPGELQPFDYVINCAAETKYGQEQSVYDYRCTELSRQVATKAKEMGVRRFIEVSTALLYKSQTKAPSVETGKIDTFTKQSKAKLAAEQVVLALNDASFEVVVARLPVVYGPGDVNGLMSVLVCAASYVELQEKMVMLWDASMKVNTVHVEDAVRGIWHLATTTAAPGGSIWNICDKNDTDQGKLAVIFAGLYGISVGFHGTIVSNLSRLRFDDVVNIANEKHGEPWEALCKQHNIQKTPLSPFICRELLEHHHVFVDGTAIERQTGFRYLHQMMTLQDVREAIQCAIEAGIFPPVLTGMEGNKNNCNTKK